MPFENSNLLDARIAALQEVVRDLERHDRERDAQFRIARTERERLHSDDGLWTGRPCPTCAGHGDGCRACAGTGDEHLFWKEVALLLYSAFKKAQSTLQSIHDVAGIAAATDQSLLSMRLLPPEKP